jgi:hypothetical protein
MSSCGTVHKPSVRHSAVADYPWDPDAGVLSPDRQRLPIVVVIDGQTPELSERAAASLAARLIAEPNLFHSVQRPDGGTASMGELLMISLVWTLVSALLFQPALMGPPLVDSGHAVTAS